MRDAYRNGWADRSALAAESPDEGFDKWFGGIRRLIVHYDIHMVSEEKADELEARSLKPQSRSDMMRAELIADGWPEKGVGTVYPLSVRKRDLDPATWPDDPELWGDK